MLLEYFPIQSVVCYHDIADTWPWSLQLTLSSRMSQVRTALDHQAGSYINSLLSQDHVSVQMIFTFDIDIKPLACNIRRDWHWWKKEWDARNPNYHDGLQYLIYVVIGFGGSCEIIRGLNQKTTAPFLKFCKATISCLSFQEVYKYCGLLDWLAPSAQLKKFQDNSLMRRPDLSSLMFSVAWKEKNSVWVKHSADLPEGRYWHKSQFRYNELQPISFGVRYSRINWTSFLYFLWTFWIKTCWKSPCECRTSPKEGRNGARWDKEWRLTHLEPLFILEH